MNGSLFGGLSRGEAVLSRVLIKGSTISSHLTCHHPICTPYLPPPTYVYPQPTTTTHLYVLPTYLPPPTHLLATTTTHLYVPPTYLPHIYVPPYLCICKSLLFPTRTIGILQEGVQEGVREGVQIRVYRERYEIQST